MMGIFREKIMIFSRELLSAEEIKIVYRVDL